MTLTIISSVYLLLFLILLIKYTANRIAITIKSIVNTNNKIF